ncbi:MAG: PQQ-binding-like beta-propeller repeat protein [Planctomycetaceae bacterium]
MITSRLAYGILAFVVPGGLAGAGDWPQILGPNRDGIAVDEKLLDAWPSAGPQTVWAAQTGEGFAGVAVRDGILVLFHRRDDSEIAEARDAVTGDQVWSAEFGCRYESGLSSDNGPRCVPIMTGDRVVVFGVTGNLRCLDLQTGNEIWHRDTWSDFSAPEGYFGAGSTPVVDGDRVIVNVGGRDDAAVVAFSLQDGETLWHSFSDAASYSSPVIAEVDGTRHAIVVTRLNAVSLNPEDGTVRFSFPFGARGPTVNGATPVVMDDHLFLSSSYRVGSVWAGISATKGTPTGSGETLLATQYATPIRYKNVLFAVDGRQDIGRASLKCINPAAQKVMWSQDGFDYGSLIRVNDELLFLNVAGELIRFAADESAYRESHRSQVLQPTPRGYRLPALSNGRLYVRDDRELKCLLVGKPD